MQLDKKEEERKVEKNQRELDFEEED